MNRFILKNFLLAIFALFLLAPTNHLFAQGLGGVKTASIDLKPKYPLAGERVKATLNAPSLDVDTALISWVVDGKVVQQSYSGKDFEFDAGKVGDHMIIQVNAEDGAHKKITTKRDLYISDLVVTWEGMTYTPPFYKGRSLASPGSYVTLSAIPSVTKSNGSLYDKKELSYVWKSGGASVPKITGFGKHSVIFQNENPYNLYNIYLEVKDPSGEIRATKSLIIPNTQPVVYLYEDNPYGIYYDRVIGSVYGIYQKEATVVAEPYFMSASSRIDPVLTYTWTVGGETYNSLGKITFGAEGDGFGSTKLNLIIKNLEYWLQGARLEARIDFGGRNQWLDTNPETTTL